MNYNVIPLTKDPDQSLTCTIQIDGRNVSLFFRFRYNTVAEYWVMTITNGGTGEIIIDSSPLFFGVFPSANLLEQYKHLGFGSAYIVKNGSIETDRPTSENLGTDFLLVWGDTDG